MSEESIDLTVATYKCVSRHFVTLSCVQNLGGEGQENIVLVSGFIAEFAGFWVYVTAGHILRDFEKAIDAGCEFDVWRFGDQAAEDRFNHTGVPFNFTLDRWIVLEDEENGLDYAATILEDNHRRLLEAGGVVPLGGDTWDSHLSEHDHWVLVGIPSETVNYDGRTKISARAVFIPLDSTDTPIAAGTKSKNQFYGKLRADSENKVNDLKGLSGAPIFSLRKVDGEWLYWIIGVQSAWYSSTRVVAACPFISFAEELTGAIQKVVEELSDGDEHNHDTA